MITDIDSITPGAVLARVNKRGMELYRASVFSVERNGWGDISSAMIEKDGSHDRVRKTRGMLTEQFIRISR